MGTVHVRRCHQLAASAAATAEAATWPSAQVSGNGRRRPFVTFQRENKVSVTKPQNFESSFDIFV